MSLCANECQKWKQAGENLYTDNSFCHADSSSAGQLSETCLIGF